MAITIISGCPGSGKTTLASSVAASRRNGVHILTDTFYRFISNRIDPSLGAASRQNEAVVKAFCRASAAFCADGYEVFVDGVIGPWMFPIIAPILVEFDYVLLWADLNEALARLEQRKSQASANPEVLARMYPQFEALEKEYEKHMIRVAGKTSLQVVAEYERRKAAGEFGYEHV